jgi:hypothetical protein
MGHRRVPAAALHAEGEARAGRHHRPRPRRDDAAGARGHGPDVDAEGRARAGERAGAHHLGRAAAALLRGLEHERDAAGAGRGELGLARLEQARGAEQHRRVRVVAARVHLAGVRAGKGQARRLLYRQRVDVGAQHHGVRRRPDARHDAWGKGVQGMGV